MRRNNGQWECLDWSIASTCVVHALNQVQYVTGSDRVRGGCMGAEGSYGGTVRSAFVAAEVVGIKYNVRPYRKPNLSSS